MRYFVIAFLLLISSSSIARSTCYGTVANGKIEGAVQLPASGKNFAAYSDAGVALGRTYVHNTVAAIVKAAYLELEKTSSGTRFVYGEPGWKSGGSIKPHRTHQNAPKRGQHDLALDDNSC